MAIPILRKTIQLLRRDTGAALMMAIFTVTMLMILATEIMYDTSVEFVVSAQNISQVRAHYAAKSGLEISLLRLNIYKKVIGMLGQNANSMKMIDMIWQMPFAWPPIVPGETNGVDKEAIKEKVKGSLMQGSYLATIESEGNKIDLSMLASSNATLAKATYDQILNIFTTKMQNDQEFASKHSGEDFAKIVTNIKDYVSSGTKSDAGGDKTALYENLNTENAKYPPDQPFKTFQELHMVAGMTDEYFDMLLPQVTIFGTKSLNVKYAPKDLLMSVLHLTSEQADQVITERSKDDTTSFKDVKTFLSYLESLGVRQEDIVDSATQKPKVNIVVDPEFNFRIRSTGTSGKVSREITAIVYDYDKVLAQLKAIMPQPSPSPTLPGATPPLGASPNPSPSASPASSSGDTSTRPAIVYFSEI